MRDGCVPVAAAAALFAAILPAAAGAGQAPPSVETVPRAVGPFDAGTVGVEFGAAGLGELWHLNGSREWLAGGSAGVWWSFRDGRSLIVQFNATEIFQAAPRHAFVNGFVPTLRWRLGTRREMNVFAELGVGVTWSDTRVPPRGTRFNYLAETGFGVARRVGRQTHAIAGLRLLHLSNNDREGPGRNPDIEAIGGYAALAVGF